MRFWRENRADAALRERFVVPAEEYERFAAALRKAVTAHEEREEENIRQMAARIREAERRQRDTVRAALEVGAAELSPSNRDRALCWTSGLQLRCGIRPETEGKGNVHTGAKPPWLTDEDEEDGSKQQIGPSYEEFLRQMEKQKLKKLPAERVGANFDHTSQTGDSWLPSFGRVWNHGRRWQSRHQFRAESGGKKKKR
uniref:Coiled-coil domain containing 84 n=1 Tax=Chrysolophus pictus TaxID=9089 RepID=A0A8C3LTI6_CHRPC